MNIENLSVKVWEKLVGKHRTQDELEKFQADIIGDGFDHHAVAKTASEALLLAAQRWRRYDAPPCGDLASMSIGEIRANIAAGGDRTDWARVNALSDEEIEAAMRDDPDWKDHIDDDWSKAELVLPQITRLKVKPIVWKTDSVSIWEDAQSPRYDIEPVGSSFRLSYAGTAIRFSDEQTYFPTEEKAKAAAQAHKERRILSEIMEIAK